MLDFLKGNKTDIRIHLDHPDGIYHPGEKVAVTIEIQPEKDLKLKGAQVCLCATEIYKYNTTSSSTDSDGQTTETTNTYEDYNKFFNQEEKFLAETSLPGGQTQRYSFQAGLPGDALPSFVGTAIRVVWEVQVKLDRPLAGNLHAEKGLTLRVPGPASLTVSPGDYGESNEPKEAEMALALPALEHRIGQPIQGQLRVMPHKDFSAEVRLELLRVETTYHSDGYYASTALPYKLAGNTNFCAGQAQSFPFEVCVPDNEITSVETPNGAVNWKIKAVLARRLRDDTFLEQAITIYAL